MIRISFLSLFFLAVSFTGTSHAHFTGKGHVHTLSTNSKVFSNSSCQLADSCDLKRFALTTSTYEIWFSDAPENPTYTKGAVMEYETESVEALERYAIVQFKKGCVFHSAKDPDGKIVTSIGDTVRSFGENVW